MSTRQIRSLCLSLAIITSTAGAIGHFAVNAADSRPPVVSDAKNGESEFRVREGAKWEDEVGEFQAAGERIRFHSRDRDIKLTVLENLALERVARVLDETREPPLWSVSGMVTEFHGGNYLLVTRAVVKARQ